MVLIKKTLLIVFLTGMCLPYAQCWQSKLREDGKLIISNLSLNEERVFSSRVRGKLSIILDNQNLLLAINWGDFANLSDANVFYNIKEYGLFEEDWKLSNDGKVAYSPNPVLMLLEILVSDTLIIGIRPKYNNEIRYTFNINNLSEHILKNKSRFSFIEDLDLYGKDEQFALESTNVKLKLNKNILIKRDTRFVKYKTRHNDMFFFSSFSSPVNFESNLLTSNNTSDLFYFNKWLRKKGVLFTDVDMRIFKFFKDSPTVIPYEDIHSLLLKGNNISGYRIHLNNKHIASFPKSTKDEVQSIFTFLKNR